MTKRKYRIVEEEYEDGHKFYVAQESVKFLGIVVGWSNFIHDSGIKSSSIRRCMSPASYDECLITLHEMLDNAEAERKKWTIKRKRYFNL